MGLLDSILSQVTGGGGSSNPLLNVVLNMVTHQSGGGIAGLVQQFESAGLGQQAASWVGTGPNQPITADHVNQALGSDKIQQIAQQLGLDPAQVSSQLAQLIPKVVNHLTPNGQVPQGGDLQSSIAGLLQHALFKNA